MHSIYAFSFYLYNMPTKKQLSDRWASEMALGQSPANDYNVRGSSNANIGMDFNNKPFSGKVIGHYEYDPVNRDLKIVIHKEVVIPKYVRWLLNGQVVKHESIDWKTFEHPSDLVPATEEEYIECQKQIAELHLKMHIKNPFDPWEE